MKFIFIDFLIELIWQYSNNQSVELKSDIKLSYIDANNLVPFGLILNELVFNTLEHGIEENGVISVKIQEDLDQVFFEYRDSGVGFIKDYVEGFGSELIRILTEQLNGELKSDLSLEKGVLFQFIFPKLG